MIIHFTSARASVVEDIKTLRRIVSIIHSLGHVLARDWIEPQHHLSMNETNAAVPPEQIYKQSMDAVERADLIIAEGSQKSFGLGMQVSAAMNKKKPVLFLVRQDAQAYESIMSQGVTDPLFTRRIYDADTLEKAITEFIKDNTIAAKDLRFNFVIDRQLYNHIRWKSFNDRKTKAEVVRELLLRDMEKGES
jgi:hypothetical protein